jgi:hypothetical protein
MRRILLSSDWDKRKHRDDRNSIYWMPNRMYPVPRGSLFLAESSFWYRQLLRSITNVAIRHRNILRWVPGFEPCYSPS